MDVLRDIGCCWSSDLDQLRGAWEFLVGVGEFDIDVTVRARVVGVELEDHVYPELCGWVGVVEDAGIEWAAVVTETEAEK